MTNSQPPAKSAERSPMEWENIAACELLDYLSNPIMVADGDYVIRYANKAAYDMFAKIEADIRKDLPNFNARDVVGRSVDQFHKNPSYQRGIMDRMSAPHDGRFTVGGRSLRFMATPQFDKERKMLGVFVEWQDQTEAMRAEQNANALRAEFEKLIAEMQEMARAHDAGNIGRIVDHNGFQDPNIANAARLVSEMVNAHVDTKKRAIAVFEAFGMGDFDADIDPLPGEKAFINDAINRTRDNFRALTREITQMSDAIVAGNLDVQVDVQKFTGEYRQIVESFDRSFSSLNMAFLAIQEQVGQVSQTVDQMSNSSQALSTNSQISSASVDEVSSSAEETDAQVRANAESAQKAARMVASAAQIAEQGAGKINDMVGAMGGIKTSSQDIAKIIKVIDEIAFQTNLLALNAAVEAARAGQHGRGFAVVAQEVRNLAGRSAKAARETSDLIEDAASRVNSGVKIAEETAQAFAQITNEIGQVSHVVQEIDKSSSEQARGVAQITQAIAEIAKTTLVTSQQADELAATSAQINAATQQMGQELGRFKLRRGGSTAMGSSAQMAQVSPELMAQIQRMMGSSAAPAAKTNGRASVNKDMRGYGPF